MSPIWHHEGFFIILNIKCLTIFTTLLVTRNAHTRCPPQPWQNLHRQHRKCLGCLWPLQNVRDAGGDWRAEEQKPRCIRQKYGRSVMATNIGTWPLPHCSLLMSGPISAIKGSRAAHSVKWRSGNCEENSNFITHWNGQICAEMRSRHHCPKKS